MRDDSIDEYGIKKLQDKILEIMVYIDRFCQENEITYYLMGGSALGAIRHQGFIPWDDDLDIFMDYHNYKKFQECCTTKLDREKFYFQREDTKENPYFFSKLRMNGTTCINEYLKIGHQGIFVDIMCLNNAPKSTFAKKIQYYSAGLLKARAIARTKYKTKSFKKKMQLFVSKCVVWGPIKKILLYLVRKYNKKDTLEYAHVFGRAKFNNSYYKASDFKEQKKVPFEKIELCVPNGVENYLQVRYGNDYMQMPSEETKKIYQSHAMLWNTEKDYKEYEDVKS